MPRVYLHVRALSRGRTIAARAAVSTGPETLGADVYSCGSGACVKAGKAGMGGRRGGVSRTGGAGLATPTGLVSRGASERAASCRATSGSTRASASPARAVLQQRRWRRSARRRHGAPGTTQPCRSSSGRASAAAPGGRTARASSCRSSSGRPGGAKLATPGGTVARAWA